MTLPTYGRRYSRTPAPAPAPGPQPGQTAGTGWKAMIDNNNVVPFVGDSLVHDKLMPVPFKDFMRCWAQSNDVGYPWPDQATQTLVAQFIRMRDSDTQARLKYLSFLKNQMFQKAEEEYEHPEQVQPGPAGPPAVVSDIQLLKAREKLHDKPDDYSLTDLAYDLGRLDPDTTQGHPLRTLAKLDFTIYLTTSYHRMLEVALFQAGKQPVSEMYHWKPQIRFPAGSIFEKEPDYIPSIQRPLVYHLFGRDDVPESLVISESDYLELLINLASEQAGTQVGNNIDSSGRPVLQGLPVVVKQALSQPGSAPLLLGYDLNEWDFRVLFRGLILSKHHTGSGEGLIIIQLARPAGSIDEDSVKTSLEKYMRVASNLRIYWGSVKDCIESIEKDYKGYR